ncbi:MAG: hypothetical protein E3J96_04300 [Sulfurovum sp.]|nr:MAG: hypothetical protein E3J96_04300 [Sulfurovum sp.]
MYYITNQNNQIIAIDPSLLALLEVENIDELYREIALGDIKFSSSAEDGKVTITTAQNEETYDVKNNNLSGMLGNITLVQVQTFPEESMLIDDDISTFTLAENDEESSITKDENELVEKILKLDVSTEEEISLLHDDLISIKGTDDLLENDTSILDDSEEEAKEQSGDEQEISLLTDDSMDNEETRESSATEENDDALFDLVLPNAPEETIDKIAITITGKEQVETADDNQAPIVIDVKNISQSIGISTEDYNTFLTEYIDTALSLEKDLQSTQEEKRSHAIGTLSHLSNVLHLPVVSEIVTQMENATADNQNTHIESFYTTLARLTTSQLETAKEETSSILGIDSEIKVEAVDSVVIDSIDLHEEEPLSVPEAESVTTTTESFGTINLNDVQPIHFDFQLEQSAKDLSLPVELIEEFVHDFIGQAHVETEKILEAYEKGDLDTIQKIGHLLKGTSSNLRINPLSDTLYEIQFCEDSSKLEGMIRHYWAHFLSLETQINLISK